MNEHFHYYKKECAVLTQKEPNTKIIEYLSKQNILKKGDSKIVFSCQLVTNRSKKSNIFSKTPACSKRMERSTYADGLADEKQKIEVSTLTLEAELNREN